MTTTTTGSRLPAADGRARATLWGGPLILGLLIVVLGIVALVATGVTGVASVLLLGSLLVAGGLVELVSAFRDRAAGRFLLHLVGGLFSIVVGVFFWIRPVAGLASLTLLFGSFLACVGLLRGITSVMDRYPGWGWDAFYGLLALALGVVVLASWPISTVWAIGTLVAVELIGRGIAMVALAMGVRRTLHGEPPRREVLAT
jgi:uncharacterized membrane protein HdeD (DUF308 family)